MGTASAADIVECVEYLGRDVAFFQLGDFKVLLDSSVLSFIAVPQQLPVGCKGSPLWCTAMKVQCGTSSC